ncbi:MAG: hypothetical protein Q9227_006280 [Pyrenula ochraceoflavens]
MKAVVLQGEGKVSVVSDRPTPSLRDGYVLVKTHAVAVNPTDWKTADRNNRPGFLLGCDYAGVVEQVGEHVTKKWKAGDRICGMAHGGSSNYQESGAFAEHIVVKGDVAMHIPENLSFEEAATLGVGIFTVGQGLYQSLELEMPENPTKEKKPILIYGGSTATGILGIQFAKASGYDPIATCSPKNFDAVEEAGAEGAFNYHEPDCAARIRDYTNNNLQLAWDCIGSQDSAQFCADSLSSIRGCKYAAIIPNKFPREDVPTWYTMAYTHLGEAWAVPNKEYPASLEDFNFAKMWALVAERELAEGRVKVHKPRIGKGLEGVVEGLDLLRNGKVSGEKLVYTLS